MKSLSAIFRGLRSRNSALHRLSNETRSACEDLLWKNKNKTLQCNKCPLTGGRSARPDGTFEGKGSSESHNQVDMGALKQPPPTSRPGFWLSYEKFGSLREMGDHLR
jgi:hypothetical protein